MIIMLMIVMFALAMTMCYDASYSVYAHSCGDAGYYACVDYHAYDDADDSDDCDYLDYDAADECVFLCL